MYLKSIELSGFKSFAKKSELNFTSKISAIVGPNGSGKSNIAEAFSFVLGEQSIKSLRGKKGEDLIWNGAADMPRANRASVKVVFDNSSKFLPLDYETVTIERVVHRDSVNEYLINGSQVRLRDVVELLSSAHIGASGHHIISQGEADRILSANIKERKEMIEDALGLKLYQYKKQESQRKLEKTGENIKQTESLRREIAPHIKFLKKQVEKVQKAIELKEELQKEALEYCSREDEYISSQKLKIESQKLPLEEKEKKLDQELKEARSVLGSAKNRDEVSKELIKLGYDLTKIRDEKGNLLRQIGRLDGEMDSLLKIMKKQQRTSPEDKTVSMASVENLSGQIELKIKQAKSSNDLNKLLETLDEISMLLSGFMERNIGRMESFFAADVEKEINDLQKSKIQIEKSLVDLKKREGKISLEYEKFQNKIEKEKDSNRDAEKAIFHIMAESQEVKSKLRELQNEEEKLRLVSEDFKRELTELGHLLGTGLLNFSALGNPSGWDNEPRSNQEERRRKIEKIKIRLEDAGGIGDTETLKEYSEVSERDAFLEKELLDLGKSAASLSELISDLDNRLSIEFKSGVEKINKQFKEYFALMFGGGSAELSVVKPVKTKSVDGDLLFDEADPHYAEGFSEARGYDGLEIEVNLPKKKIKGLMMLSGGERALTSIALLFAMSLVNPPPFIILDETDAALDEANSKKYADMIENLSKYSQLILITHNRETMSRAGVLYGVTMGHGGGSKLLSVSFDDAVAVAK